MVDENTAEATNNTADADGPSIEDRLSAIEAHLGLHDTNTDAVAVPEDEPEAAADEDKSEA